MSALELYSLKTELLHAIADAADLDSSKRSALPRSARRAASPS